MNVHKMHVRPRYFDLLRTGQKKVEFRLFDNKRRGISVGDKISFVCEGNDTEKVNLTVSSIVHSKTFSELLSLIPQPLIGGVPVETQLRDLNEFYELETQRSTGVIAILLE